MKLSLPRFPHMTVIKGANITDSLTNSLWPLFTFMTLNPLMMVVSIPMFCLAWLIPPALSRFSYAAATDKKAWILVSGIGAATIFLTVVGLKAANDVVTKVASNRAAYHGVIKESNTVLLSKREIDKCHGQVSGQCVVRDQVEKVKNDAKKLAYAIPAFSVSEVKLTVFGKTMSGDTLTSTLSIIAAITLALIQMCLPFYMAKTGQGTVEEIFPKKQAA